MSDAPEILAFFDEPTQTASYLVADPATGSAAVIDPVLDYDAASARIGSASVEAIMAAAEARIAEKGYSRLVAAQALDIEDWLPHDLLLKLDRCLMAHAIEGRTPFLDKGVAEAAFRLPDGLKVRGGMGKYILRKWLEKNLPIARPFAPKQGFTVPVGEWIKGRGPELGKLVAAQPGIQEIAHPDRVAALFGNIYRWRQGFACWKLLFYALWHRRHILGLEPVGGHQELEARHAACGTRV